jgi:parallel beta-helix repeat protein
MSVNVSVNGYSCFNITATNVTLDCHGFNITGNNTTLTYGVYSIASSSTIRNCNIRNFSTGIYINSTSANYVNITNNTINLTYSTSCDGTTGRCSGIYLTGARYGTISYNQVNVNKYAISLYGSAKDNIITYNNVSTTNTAILLYNMVNNNTISYNNLSASTYALDIESSSKYNTVSYNNMTSPSSQAIYISTFGNSNNFSYNSISSGGTRAISIVASNNNTFLSNNFSSTSATSVYGTIYIESGSSNNSFVSNIINETNTSANCEKPIYIDSGQNNSFYNNTIQSASASGTPAIYLAAASGNNTFLYNNITSNMWIQDLNQSSTSANHTTNIFNNSNAGNIYYWVSGIGAWEVFNISATTGVWADGGSSRPFNTTTVTGNFTGAGQPNDWYPYTLNVNNPPNVSSISLTPTVPYNSSVLNCLVTVLDDRTSPLNVSYNWFKNGTNQTALAGTALIDNNTATLFNLSLSGITNASDNWSCAIQVSDGMSSSGLNYSANVTVANISLSVGVAYPLEGDMYPLNTCRLPITVQTNSTDNFTTTYRLYYQNGSVSAPWSLITSGSCTIQNCSANLTIPFNSSGHWRINATSTSSYINASSSNVSFILYDTIACTNPNEIDNNEYVIVSLIILAIGCIYFSPRFSVFGEIWEGIGWAFGAIGFFLLAITSYIFQQLFPSGPYQTIFGFVVLIFQVGGFVFMAIIFYRLYQMIKKVVFNMINIEVAWQQYKTLILSRAPNKQARLNAIAKFRELEAQGEAFKQWREKLFKKGIDITKQPKDQIFQSIKDLADKKVDVYGDEPKSD